MMNSDNPGPINIGNPTEITINTLAQQIISYTDSKSSIINLELPQDDPKKRKPDITTVKVLLNWTPKYNLEEGLKLTIKYFKNLDTILTSS